MASQFLGQLEAQPWFASVEHVFASAGVPAPLWESTIEVEDPSLNPEAVNNNPATGDNSHGLFQINLYGSLASDPSRVEAAFGSPVQQAQWAAAQMGSAISGMQGESLSTQLQAIENAGWPGNLSEDAQRQAALADVTGAPSSSGVNIPGTNLTVDTPNSLGGLADSINNFNADAGNWIFNLGVGAFFLALLAGGFALIASGNTTVDNAAKGAALAA